MPRCGRPGRWTVGGCPRRNYSSSALRTGPCSQMHLAGLVSRVAEAEAEDHVTEPAAIPAAGGPAGALPPLSRNHLVNQPELPLLGVLPAWRVIDLSQAISGPYSARILSDLGADVLRLEGPPTDVTEYFGVAAGQRSGMYSQMDAGNRSVRVDLARAGAAAPARGPPARAPRRTR